MACKIKSKTSSLEYNRNNTFVKSAFIGNSASKGGGGGGGHKKIITRHFFPFVAVVLAQKRPVL